MRWDDGVQIDAIGLSDGGMLSVASHWQPEDIPGGGTITKVRIGVHDIPDSAAVKIWQGNDPDAMELRYSQAFTPAARQINEVVLDPPYKIDASQELFIGWSATHVTGEYPFALDAATNANQQGNCCCSMAPGRISAMPTWPVTGSYTHLLKTHASQTMTAALRNPCVQPVCVFSHADRQMQR